MSGVINVLKPAGMTSRTVVDRIERLVRPAKAGHAGTLDPLASGVLVVCVGAATRLIEYVQRMPKRYTGTFLLGRSSTTEDIEGEITELPNPPQPSRDELARAAASFVGSIQQRPPQFSALKVAGRRAYALARKGEHVELAPRPVTISRCDVLDFDYPRLVLDIECSRGTYVRSLGRDLAERVGSAAVMSDLMRTAVGHFEIATARPLESLSTIGDALLPAAEAVRDLPGVLLAEAEVARVGRGQAIPLPATADAAATELAAFDERGRLVAILGARGTGLLGPLRNFPV